MGRELKIEATSAKRLDFVVVTMADYVNQILSQTICSIKNVPHNIPANIKALKSFPMMESFILLLLKVIENWT